MQRQRLNAVAKNIANANTTRDENGKVYQREVVIVRGKKNTPFDEMLEQKLSLTRTNSAHADPMTPGIQAPEMNTLSSNVAHGNSAPRLVYDPTHPDANEEGYVEMPNVNVVTEMVEMIAAQRAFEANTGVISAAKNMAKESIDI